MYDPALEQMEEQLAEVESLLSDYNQDVSEYMSDLEFDEEGFQEHRGTAEYHQSPSKENYGKNRRDTQIQREEKEAYLKTGGL